MCGKGSWEGNAEGHRWVWRDSTRRRGDGSGGRPLVNSGHSLGQACSIPYVSTNVPAESSRGREPLAHAHFLLLQPGVPGGGPNRQPHRW